jgi:integrase
MPRIVKRKNVFYAEYYGREKGFTTRVSLGTDDLREAERQFGELLIQQSTPRRASLSSITVDVLVGKYYAEVAKHFPSKYTYKSALDYVVEFIPGRSIEWFDQRNQERFVKSLREKGLADGTIQRAMSIIGRSLTWAWQQRMISERPYVMTVQSFKTRDRILTDDEARALIGACRTENEKRLVLLLLTTGSRPQALIEAQAGQFDRQARLIDLNPKGREQNRKKHRPIIPMTQAVYDACELWESGPVFVVGSDHHQLKSVRSVWEPLHKRSGLPDDITCYVLRHTVATELRKQGVPEWDVSGYLGHKAPGARTTGRYAHWRPDYMRAAAEAMDSYWGRLCGKSELAAGGVEAGVISDGEVPALLENRGYGTVNISQDIGGH